MLTGIILGLSVVGSAGTGQCECAPGYNPNPLKSPASPSACDPAPCANGQVVGRGRGASGLCVCNVGYAGGGEWIPGASFPACTRAHEAGAGTSGTCLLPSLLPATVSCRTETLASVAPAVSFTSRRRRTHETGPPAPKYSPWPKGSILAPCGNSSAASAQQCIFALPADASHVLRFAGRQVNTICHSLPAEGGKWGNGALAPCGAGVSSKRTCIWGLPDISGFGELRIDPQSGTCDMPLLTGRFGNINGDDHNSYGHGHRAGGEGMYSDAVTAPCADGLHAPSCIYGIPWHASDLLQLDTVVGSRKYWSYSVRNGYSKWSAGFAAPCGPPEGGTCIFGIPYTWPSILRFSISDQRSPGAGANVMIDGPGQLYLVHRGYTQPEAFIPGKWLSAADVSCGDGRCIYAVPYHRQVTHVLKINASSTAATATSRLEVPGLNASLLPGSVGSYFSAAVVAPCGVDKECIFACPVDAMAALKIDLALGQPSLIGLHQVGTARQKYRYSTLGPCSSGRICVFCIPSSAEHVLRIDPLNDRVTLLNVSSAGGSSGGGAARQFGPPAVLPQRGGVSLIHAAPADGDAIITIDDMPCISTASELKRLSHCTSIDHICIANCSDCVSLAPLSRLTHVGTRNDSTEEQSTRLIIGNNPALSSLSGLSNLRRVHGAFTLLDNPALQHVADLTTLSTIGRDSSGNSLVIERNRELESVAGLSGLRGQIRGRLRITDCPKLQTLGGAFHQVSQWHDGIDDVYISMAISNNSQFLCENITCLGKELLAGCPPGFTGFLSGAPNPPANNCTSCRSLGARCCPGKEDAKCTTCTFNAPACFSCPMGRYSTAGGLFCTKCDSGKRSAAGATKCTDLCETGYYQVGVSACAACAAGRYSVITFGVGRTTQDCAECPASKFQNEAAQGFCYTCPENTFTIFTGIGATSEANCTSSFAAQICGPGFSSSGASAKSCTACRAGRFKKGTNTEPCKLCPCARFSAIGAVACDSICPRGRFGNQTSGTCDPCPADHFCVASRKQHFVEASSCAPGQTAITNTPNASSDRLCQVCSRGYYSNAVNSAKCTKCASGWFQKNDGQSFCFECGVGKYLSSGYDCTACAAGHYQNSTGASACVSCPAGKHQPTEGQALCLDCAPGQVQNGAAAQACERCPVGLYQPNASQAVCAACGVCSTGVKRNACGGAFQGVCVTCAPGNFINMSSQLCTPCAKGTYQNVSDAKSCKRCGMCSNGLSRKRCGIAFEGVCPVCPPGTFVNASTQQCMVCGEGTYQNETNAASCKDCEMCASGARQKCGGAFEGVCGVCTPGNFINASSRQCTACAKGTYQDVSDATSCKICGTCSNGLPRDECGGAFKGVCGVCSPGHFINATAQECVPCSAGRFGNDTTLLCQDCPSGKFQRESGKPFCESCPEGYVCDEEAKTSSGGAGLLVEPRACPAGKQCNGTAVSATCADDGKVSDPTGTGQCISCPDLTFADVNGERCVECPRDPTNAARVLRGVECTGGRIRIKKDFFVVADSDDSVTGDAVLGPNMIVQPCREYGVCAAAESSDSSMQVHTKCLGNTTGPLCGSCVDGFGKAAGTCVVCPAKGAQVAIMLAVALMCLALCLLMTKKSLQSELDLDTATVSVLRIGLNFLVMTGFLAALQLDWGSVLRSIFNVAKASSGGVPPLMACAGVSFEAEITFSLLLPLMVPCVPALMLVTWAVHRCARGRTIAGARILGAEKLHFFVNSSIAVAYLLWPALVVQVMRVLDCSVEIAGDRYVASDVSVRCFHGAHTRLYVGAVFELVTVVPALPMLLYLRLRRRPLGSGTQNRKHLYFLYGGFRRGYEYWEAVVMARKFLLLTVSVVLADNTFGLQVVAVMWIMCIAFVLQLLCRPYHNSTEQELEKLSLGVITVACMVGQLILQARGEHGLGTAGAAACRAFVGSLIIGTCIRFAMFFTREVQGAGQRKKSARRKDEHAIPAEAPDRPTTPSVSGGEHFAAENPLNSQRGSDSSLGAAAPTLVLAQAGQQRHESTRANAEDGLKSRARAIFSTVPVEPQRRPVAGNNDTAAPAQETAV